MVNVRNRIFEYSRHMLMYLNLKRGWYLQYVFYIPHLYHHYDIFSFMIYPGHGKKEVRVRSHKDTPIFHFPPNSCWVHEVLRCVQMWNCTSLSA